MTTLYDVYDAKGYPHKPALATFTNLEDAKWFARLTWMQDTFLEYDETPGQVVVHVFCLVSGMLDGAITKGWAYDSLDEWEKEMMI